VKPGYASRGRGIVVLSKYYDILKYIKEAKGRNWVIQKYIENPLIINKRKFDIRQWVLVTSWNPLTVWIYTDNYVRFAMLEYDPKNQNKYSHLTNNCLAQTFQQSPEHKKKIKDESESGSDDEDENIWSCQDFQEYLNAHHHLPDCQDIFREKIMTQIKH
jgi:tubulin monoglycylase TTLL3/8